MYGHHERREPCKVPHVESSLLAHVDNLISHFHSHSVTSRISHYLVAAIRNPRAL